MGGKGQRRREKNYRAAHGGYSRLPPPPDPSQLDALPSKLRKIISFTNPTQQQTPKHVEKKKSADGDSEKLVHQKNKSESRKNDVKERDSSRQLKIPQDNVDSDGHEHMSTGEKKKKKRKRNQVTDLRFEEMEKSSAQLKRRERKKKFLESKKKKQKNAKKEDEVDFPGREEIKFGDVVEAPLKLVTVPKAFKNVQDASQERLRLKAIEAYRNRKGWISRPGINLSSPVTASSIP